MDTAEAGQRWSEKANAALDAEMDALYDLLGQEPKFEYKENRTDAERSLEDIDGVLSKLDDLGKVSPPLPEPATETSSEKADSTQDTYLTASYIDRELMGETMTGEIPPGPTRRIHKGESAIFSFDTMMNELDEIGAELGNSNWKEDQESPEINRIEKPQVRLNRLSDKTQTRVNPAFAKSNSVNLSVSSVNQSAPVSASTTAANNALEESVNELMSSLEDSKSNSTPKTEIGRHHALGDTFLNELNQLEEQFNPSTPSAQIAVTTSVQTQSPFPHTNQRPISRMLNTAQEDLLAGITEDLNGRHPDVPKSEPQFTPAEPPRQTELPELPTPGPSYDPQFCAGCGKQFTVGTVLRALERRWHPECFRCTNCLVPITSNQYLYKDNMPFCINCKFAFSPKCGHCGAPMEGAAVKIPETGALMHPGCYPVWKEIRDRK